jgi:hypothetical protein
MRQPVAPELAFRAAARARHAARFSGRTTAIPYRIDPQSFSDTITWSAVSMPLL